MSLSKQNIYKGLCLKLQGEGVHALGVLQGLFDAPNPDLEAILEAIAEINRCENALSVLQQYIESQITPPPPAPQPAPPPPTPPQTSVVVDEKRSPTFKRTKERRAKATAKSQTKKSDE